MEGIRKKDVKIGGYYAIKHTSSPYGKLSVIRIDGESIYGGWNATNLKTNRSIRIRSNTKLRYEVKLNPDWADTAPATVKKWLKVEAA